MSIQQSLLLPQALPPAFRPHHDALNSQESAIPRSCRPHSTIHSHEHTCSIISSPLEQNHSETTLDPEPYETSQQLDEASLLGLREPAGENSSQRRENDSSRRQQLLEQLLQLKQQYKQKMQQQEAGRVLCVEIATLEAQRLLLYEKYSQNHILYSQKYHDYCEIMEDHEHIEEEINRIEENIHYLQKEVPLLRKDCSQKLEERKRIETEIRKFQAKKEELSLVLKAENQTLQKMIDQNLLIEEQIKFSRQQYEKYQQKIFDLDQKGQNLKKYGCQTVNPSTMALFSQKERLQSQLLALQEQISHQRKTIQKMVPIDKANKLKTEIDKLQTMKSEKAFFEVQNKQLKEENQLLGEVKYQYEWNPNLQIKSLENSQAEKEIKIENIENEINLFKKQTTEIQQKIDDFEQYLRFSEITSPTENSDSSLGSPRKHPRDKMFKREKSERSRPIYESIKQQIEQGGSKKDFSFNFWKNIGVSGMQAGPEIIQIDAFTYRVNKRRRLWQILSVFTVLLLMAWGYFVVYKR